MRLIAATLLALAAWLLPAASSALAADYAFRGNFVSDDDVRFVTFRVGQLSWITLRTQSYAGGTDAAGQPVAPGGFDTVVTVFDAAGRLLSGSDDGMGLPSDPRTHKSFDTHFRLLLAAGDYLASITQYDNTAKGPTLSHGFTRAGDGDFTPALTYCEAERFCDVSGAHPFNQRSNRWALDVLDVNVATLAPVPEPASWMSLAAGLGLVVWFRSRRIPRAT